MRRTRGMIGAASLLALTAGAAPAMGRPLPSPSAHAARPNIVVVLVDDMGYSDIGAFGGEIPTPNIDALAANGLRFTSFYNAARCSPTRASLLTGLYPHQAGVGHLESVVIPGSTGTQGKLADRAVTLAEVARTAGYFTAISGKWHVGETLGVGPWQRGFDRSMITPINAVYFPDQKHGSDKTFRLDGRKLPWASQEIGQGQWYSTDLYTDWAERFVSEAQDAKKPFFLYLAMTAPHFPLMAPQDEIARFKGRYLAGWDALRSARFARQKQIGIVAPQTRLSPKPRYVYDWDRLSVAERERFDTQMAVYAATIARVDAAVGRLVAHLKASNAYDDTLILFLSDNGGNGESGPDGRFSGSPPGGPQSDVWAGMNWAMLQNTPFSGVKHYTDEGGIATPLIAHWPRGIPALRRGAFVRETGHIVDIMPTLVQLTGGSYPAVAHGTATVPIQGVSLLPAFHARAIVRRAPIFWEHEGHRAIRDGRWKLVMRFGQPWRLYDMQTDPTEIDDLATREPQRVASMSEAWNRWASSSFVPAWQDRYDPYLGGRPRYAWGTSDPARYPVD